MRQPGLRSGVVAAWVVVDGGEAHDFLASRLPGFLNDPAEGAILASRFLLDFLKHVLRKIQTLFALVGPSHVQEFRELAGSLSIESGRYLWIEAPS